MPAKMIQVMLYLPSGRKRKFSIESGGEWQARLHEAIARYYPKSNRFYLVEELPKAGLSAGRPFYSGVMFEIRQNVFVHGQLVAELPLVEAAQY